MESSCRLFYETTDPKTPYLRLLSIDVWMNVFIHAIVYTAVYYVLLCIFQDKRNVSLQKLIYVWMGLVLLMLVGYVGRLCRVKCLANVLESDEEAVKQLRPAYFVWYFVG
tara:strand:+ start:478 stop:807 length:330 start_codon:yes stop_codon:yes gene_type:complete